MVPRIHLLIASAAFGATALGALAILTVEGSVPSSSAALISFGLMVAGLTGLAGLVLARAPWARWTLVGTVILAMGLASIEVSTLTWATDALGAVALVGLFGPWLRLWIRHHEVADAPGPTVVFLLSAGPAAPLFVGLCTIWSGAGPAAWLLAFTMLIASMLYGRGSKLGLWIMRLAVPIIGIGAAISTALIGGALIAIGTGAVAAAAWHPASKKTTTVIAPVLPEPVRRRTRGSDASK